MKILRNTIVLVTGLFLSIIIALFYNFVMPSWDFSEKSNQSFVNLPPNVTKEIESVRADERSYFSRWETNRIEHTVTIYLNCIQLGNKKPDTIIDNWTIIWEQDPEIYNETAEMAYKSYIKKWANDHPQQSVVYTGADACKKTVYVPVINITPEILGSEVVVEGWRIVFVRAT